MVIKALAVQAKPSSADTIRRFINTSRNYLGLQLDCHQTPLRGGEFADPPRYRSAQPAPARRVAA